MSNSQVFTSTFSKGLTSSKIHINKNPSMIGTKTTFYNFKKQNEVY
jgi:hypothetical protein